MRRIVKALLCANAMLLFMPLLFSQRVTRPSKAQSDDIIWSDPTNVSNTLPASGHPAIATDDFGYVHVFWSEEVGGKPINSEGHTLMGNTILYTRWDGVSWTLPTDILFVPGEDVAEFVAVDIDTDNRIYAVWTGQSNFYYSSAPSWQAGSAHAWSKPMILATNSARSYAESDIVVDASKNIHVAYASRGQEAGIYHIRSQDGGKTWSTPLKLSDPLDLQETSFSNAQIITDNIDRLHAVWQTNQVSGNGQAIYYAHSTDAGNSWSFPTQHRYGGPDDTFVGWPYLIAKEESELHLIYTNGSNKGRSHRVSLDGGVTWSEPLDIVMEMEGINGYVIPIADSSGQMHLIVNMRTRAEQIVGIYYAHWTEYGWSSVVPIDISSPAAPSAHYVAAATRLGNEIHVVYNDIGTGEIWHLQGTIPSVTPAPTQSIPPTPTPSLPMLPTSTTTITVTGPTTPSKIPVQQTLIDLPKPSNSESPTPAALLPGIGAAVLLVTVVIVWTRIRSR